MGAIWTTTSAWPLDICGRDFRAACGATEVPVAELRLPSAFALRTVRSFSTGEENNCSPPDSYKWLKV